MYACTRFDISKLENVYIVKTFILSKFNIFVAILPNPPAKKWENIETAIVRLIDQGPFKLLKSLSSL